MGHSRNPAICPALLRIALISRVIPLSPDTRSYLASPAPAIAVLIVRLTDKVAPFASWKSVRRPSERAAAEQLVVPRVRSVVLRKARLKDRPVLVPFVEAGCVVFFRRAIFLPVLVGVGVCSSLFDVAAVKELGV